MTTKTVTISARIPQEDAAFISQLKVSGAKTPSDKVRAILTDARRRHENRQDYRGCMVMTQDLISPVSVQTRTLELEAQMHSELVSRVLEWLPDMMAFIMSTGTGKDNEHADTQLGILEKGIANRVFRLMESILQMGVTQQCPCYDLYTVQSRIGPILELTRVINSNHQSIEEGKK